MKLKDLGDIGNVVAAVGVIISLLIVAWQINENTDTVRAEANRSLSAMVISWSSWNKDPEFAELAVRAAQGLDELSEAERVQYASFAFEIFNTWEQAYLFREQELLDEEQWLAWDRGMNSTLDNRAARALWEGAEDFYGPEFRAHVNTEYAHE